MVKQHCFPDCFALWDNALYQYNTYDQNAFNAKISLEFILLNQY